jgi:hypothetical protein
MPDVVLTEWMQVMLQEIERKREEALLALEEERLRLAQSAPPSPPSALRRSGQAS